MVDEKTSKLVKFFPSKSLGYTVYASQEAD